MQRSNLDGGGITSLQVAEKPINGKRSDVLKRSRFFEQVGCAGNDLQTLLANKYVQRLPVEPDHHSIVAADD